jgi:hypothetical protein
LCDKRWFTKSAENIFLRLSLLHAVTSGASPTTSSYNAGAVTIYNARNSIDCFYVESKLFSLL